MYIIFIYTSMYTYAFLYILYVLKKTVNGEKKSSPTACSVLSGGMVRVSDFCLK